MSDEMFRMFELAQQNYSCSQILMIMGLESQGKNNDDLVRSMAGLAGGMGFSGESCGALTGGACLLGFYAYPHDRFDLMVAELVDWFKEEIGAQYGGINCADILGDELQYKTVSVGCGSIVSGTFDKVKEILLENGINPSEARS
ncbi:DVU_1555 family C-GCAxxG-C-C protein [Desulfofalx alkaliphila]|uniref:DVU_1555 family C-GCAxxG-C-C protein n=1 Tax=Desulfofalx alkaliphila TaxID=105483 RepID=UPI0004E1400F|nr:DV_1555 family C-GCAxxG-C-C protein [Desulfofalx alkaliphila]